MTVWGISDLHLAFARDLAPERFAARWRDHAERIAREWRAVVGREDLVLLPGDVSMARNHREVQPDLAWLERLPGTKVLSPGNHDGWFNAPKKVRPMLRPSLRVVDGDAVEVGGAIVCGARAAAVPAEGEDASAMSRAVGGLGRALAEAASLRGEADAPIHVLWHFPPFSPHGSPGPAADLIREAGAASCVYGHLHAEGQWARAVQGEVDGVLYRCVAADAIGFRPLRIM